MVVPFWLAVVLWLGYLLESPERHYIGRSRWISSSKSVKGPLTILMWTSKLASLYAQLIEQTPPESKSVAKSHEPPSTQGAQYGLIKEYSLNHIVNPHII